MRLSTHKHYYPERGKLCHRSTEERYTQQSSDHHESDNTQQSMVLLDSHISKLHNAKDHRAVTTLVIETEENFIPEAQNNDTHSSDPRASEYTQQNVSLVWSSRSLATYLFFTLHKKVPKNADDKSVSTRLVRYIEVEELGYHGSTEEDNTHSCSDHHARDQLVHTTESGCCSTGAHPSPPSVIQWCRPQAEVTGNLHGFTTRQLMLACPWREGGGGMWPD